MPPETNQLPGQASSPITLQDGTQLDPKIVKVMKAIRQSETQGSKDPWNQTGDGGASLGAYQWHNNGKVLKPGELPANWRNAAQQHLGDSNAPMTPENQNKVAYKQIEAFKNQGLEPEEIAARWNGASKDPITGKYVYNNPQYGEKFRAALLGGQQILQPTQPEKPIVSQTGESSLKIVGQDQPQEKGLGEELTGRGKDIVEAWQTPDQNIASRILQTGGAIAGGLGDIIGKGLELIPGVKQLENLIGEGVGSLAKTEVGQSVMKSVKEFSEAHPELAKDIGAGFNIVTAIPIFKALGSIGRVTLDASAQALKGIAEKGAIKDLTSTILSTKTGARFLADNPSIARDMVEKRLIPSIENGKFVTSDLKGVSRNAIKDSGEQVKSILSQPTYANTTGGAGKIVAETTQKFPNAKFTYDDIVSNGRELTPKNSLLWDKFEAGKASLADINTLRSDLDKAVQTVYTKISLPPIKKELGASFASTMREFVKSTAKETVPLFEDMEKHFRIQDALKYIEGKSVKSGLIGGLIKDAGMAAGELAGGTVNVPIAGAFAGRGASGLVEKTLGRVAPRALRAGILERTGVGASKKGLMKGLIDASKKTATGAASRSLQKMNR